MSRITSPLPDDRSPKRSKISSEAQTMDHIPDQVANIVPDGDALIVITSMQHAKDNPIGLRVSTHALSLASPIFKTQLSNLPSTPLEDATHQTRQTKILPLPEDDGDAMVILLHILHLRNDKLPPRIVPELLGAVARLALKYECVVAAGRATLQWFDRLYASKTPGDVWKIIEAAYLLDEAMFFARFTSRWVLEGSLFARQMPVPSSGETAKLALTLSDQHIQSTLLLRQDLDRLATACISAFSKQNRHYIDWAPGISPGEDEATSHCHVDPQGASLYLGALHDAEVHPPTTWEQPKSPGAKGETIASLIDKLAAFREPEYGMQDRCEFCDDIRIKFTEELESVREVQRERLWGLCLDCYRAGGVSAGECRFEHEKVALLKAQLGQMTPGQVQGLMSQVQEKLMAAKGQGGQEQTDTGGTQGQPASAQQGQAQTQAPSAGLGINGL